MADRNSLLKQLGEVSFFLDDLRLYLDTHPTDQNALETYKQYYPQRKQLLKQYADEFEPLTCDCICPDTNGSDASKTLYPGQPHWTWSDGPVPWDREANSFASAMTTATGGV